MAVRVIEPDLGSQATYNLRKPFGLTRMPDQENLTPMQYQLGELQRAFAKAQVSQRRYTFALALTACTAIGLSLLNLLLMIG